MRAFPNVGLLRISDSFCIIRQSIKALKASRHIHSLLGMAWNGPLQFYVWVVWKQSEAPGHLQGHFQCKQRLKLIEFDM